MLCYAFGAALLLVGVGLFADAVHGVTYAPWLEAFWGLGAGCLGGFVLVTTKSSALVLYDDAIEIQSAVFFLRRRLRRDEVAAKTVMMLYVPTFMLYPKDKTRRRFNVGGGYAEDDYFREWMASIPMADADFLRQRWRQ